MRKRLIRWLSHNLIFALTPIGAVVFLRAVTDNFSRVAMQGHIGEVLFFTLMISVTTLGDIEDLSATIENSNLVYGVKLLLQIFSAWSALLYGVVIFDQLSTNSFPNFLPRMLKISVGLAVVLFIMCTLIQARLGYAEVNN